MILNRPKVLVLFVLLQAGIFSLGPMFCRALMARELADSPRTCCTPSSAPSKERELPKPVRSCPLHELAKLDINLGKGSTSIDGETLVKIPCTFEAPFARNPILPSEILSPLFFLRPPPSRSTFLLHSILRI